MQVSIYLCIEQQELKESPVIIFHTYCEIHSMDISVCVDSAIYNRMTNASLELYWS